MKTDAEFALFPKVRHYLRYLGNVDAQFAVKKVVRKTSKKYLFIADVHLSPGLMVAPARQL